MRHNYSMYLFWLILMLMLFVSACTGTGASEKTTLEEVPEEEQADSSQKESTEADAAQMDVDSPIKIEDVWMRPAKAGEPAELFMTLRNEGTTDDSLHDILVLGILPLFASVDFYDGEVSDSTHHYKIDVPAGETVTLAPGGYFVALEEVERDLNPGDTIEVDLHFLELGDVSVSGSVEDR